MSNPTYRRSISAGGRLRKMFEAIPTPQHRQVLVRLKAASINHRDNLIAEGRNFRGPVADNLIPLSDGAGVVEAVGAGVTRLKVGDRVASTFLPRWTAGSIDRYKAAVVTGTTIDGTLTHWRTFYDDTVVRVPEHLTWHEAATLPVAALTGWSAVNGVVPVRAGDTVLVLGTGGVALFAAQFARLIGARVIITSSSDTKLERAKALGITDTVNYVSNPQWQRQVREITNGDGADHIVETSGPGTFEQSIAACRMGGQIYCIGTQTNGPLLDGSLVLKARVALRSVTVGSHEAFDQMNRCLAVHRELRPIVDRVFGFDEAENALAYLKSGSHFGKIVIDMS